MMLRDTVPKSQSQHILIMPSERYNLHSSLRKVINAVKVFPFIMVLLQTMVVISYTILPESVLFLLDMLFYTSPLHVSLLVYLSRKLGLCKWHRLECLLPMVGIVAPLIDIYIWELPITAATFNLLIISSLLIVSVFNAYHVFIKPTINEEIHS